MRHVIIKDKKINNAEYGAWMAEDRDFWNKWCSLEPDYWTIEYDFSDYPTEYDLDGDIRPTHQFLKAQADLVHSKYHDFGTDFVIVLIHEDNWKSDPPGPSNGIWGTNYSYVYRNYHLQYCRWDRDNIANSFGTLYHERHHAFDSLIKVEIDFDINKYLGIKSWDREVTHGQNDKFQYIRYKENTDALRKIAPYLKLALGKRKKKHQDYLDGLRITVIGVLKQLVYLLRRKLNTKNGVSSQV